MEDRGQRTEDRVTVGKGQWTQSSEQEKENKGQMIEKGAQGTLTIRNDSKLNE